MNKSKSLTQKHFLVPGMIFGSWEVIREQPGCLYIYGKKTYRKRYFLCHCSCGTMRSVQIHALLRGDSTNCGCQRAEVMREGYWKWRGSFTDPKAFSSHVSKIVREGLDAR